jgi:hypothetical protein
MQSLMRRSGKVIDSSAGISSKPLLRRPCAPNGTFRTRSQPCAGATPCAHLDSRIADQVLSHKPSRGCVAICPSGADHAADGEGTTEA